jgi:hypothetical protein
MLLFFNDTKVQQTIARLNWHGGFREYQPNVQGPALVDFLYLNEANVGINKANFFVNRKIDQEIKADQEGRVSEKLTITYENQSQSNNWPAGRYKTYLRVYLPRGVKLDTILTSDPQNPGLWLPFDTKYLDTTEEFGKTVFGLLLEVPIKSEKTIEIKYGLANKIDFSQRLTSYLLMFQKQSGAYPSNYSLTFSYPQGFVPVRVIPSAVVGNDQLLVNAKINKDQIFQIDLAH